MTRCGVARNDFFFPGQINNPLLHLGGSLVGECEGENVLGGDFRMLLQYMHKPVSEHHSLPRPRAGDNLERSIYSVSHRFQLDGI